MVKLAALLVLAAVAPALVQSQRPSFAGTRPIGYPMVTTTEGLADRFGEVDGTTQRLPAEANGDRDLVDRLSKLPVDKQPFWFINWQAIEAHRENPQTYPQKPNIFAEQPNFGNTANSGSSLGNSGSNHGASIVSLMGSPNPVTSSASNTNQVNGSQATSNVNTASAGALANRFGDVVESNKNIKNQDILPNSGIGSAYPNAGDAVKNTYHKYSGLH